ncbi:LOW QUALITY PROTEIN: uncharacterized protein [Amphiura filiformis]|uniref:LOW QUALITY PROTEIN: uncharacterized protein n=1 Tax=Amphiura filiformis TaxID=82378 RepID=UPI003B21EAF0
MECRHTCRVKCKYQTLPKLLKVLNDFQNQNQFCDIDINARGNIFHAHKAVLSAVSGYFTAMFTSGFKESTQNEISIDADPDIFRMLLRFIYTGTLDTTPANACDLLEMACYLQLECAANTCSILIEYYYEAFQLSVGDAFRIAVFAGNHQHMTELIEASERYKGLKIQDLGKVDVFLQKATYEYLNVFLDQEIVLQLVISWLTYDWEKRHTYSYQLLQKVRLGIVSSKALRELIPKELLALPKCKSLIAKVRHLKASQHKLNKKYPHLFSPRILPEYTGKSTWALKHEITMMNHISAPNTCYNHRRQLQDGLKNLQKQNQFCDIDVNVGGRTFPAHKAVLCAASNFFMTKFTSGESTQSEISIDGDPDVFQELLNFAYTRSLSTKSLNPYNLLEMACNIEFTHTSALCSLIIDGYFSNGFKNISVEDAFKIIALARSYSQLEDLAGQVQRYISGNLDLRTFEQSLWMLQTATSEVWEDLLTWKELPKEKMILELITKWLQYDWEKRKSHAHSLLERIHLGLIPSKFIRKSCKALVDKVLNLKRQCSHTCRVTKYPQLFATRSTVTTPVIALITKKTDLNRYNCRRPYRFDAATFKYFDANEMCWKPLDMEGLNRMPNAYSDHSMIQVGGHLYTCGGLKDVRILDGKVHAYFTTSMEFYCYDPGSSLWSQKLPSMRVSRHSVSLVFLNGFIYAIAGLNEKGELLRDVERYDIQKQKWSHVKPLPDAFQSSNASVVAFKGKILVHEIQDETCTSVLYVYDPSVHTWQHITCGQVDEAILREKSTLYVHNDVCYRVLYMKPSGTDYEFDGDASTPCVTSLAFHAPDTRDHCTSNNIIVDAEIKQDHIPINTVCAFRIKDEVFIKDNKFVHNTGVRITPDQSTDVSLESWEDSFPTRLFEESHGNVAYFTFDINNLTPKDMW